MKTLTLVCLSLLVATCAFSGTDIDLGGKVVTFTNLQGHVFAGVKLEHANLDGVIYSLTTGGGGLVKFKDLSSNFLASLNIPPERLQTARQRERAGAEQKLRYEAAVRALALRQRQQEAVAESSASMPAQAAAEPAMSQAADSECSQLAAGGQPGSSPAQIPGHR